MAYAYLLNEIGIRAEAAISGPVNGETAFALGFFGLESPAILDRAEGKQFVLVDHSTYSQAIDGMENARIVGIVDHHGIGDVTNSEMINVRSAPVGATASLVFLAYRECEVDIPQDMARVLLMSLLSDTRNMTRNVTVVDRTAYEALVEIACIGDIDAFYRQMEVAITAYGSMTDREIFLSDYKAYDEAGVRFGIADVNAFGEDAVLEIAGRMYAVMEESSEEMDVDMLFVIINNKSGDESENMMYMAAWGEGAVEVLQEAFGCYDGERYFVFRDKLSRKKDVVPAIVRVLENRD
jgi:manganese-dependent inorganic pyrophosphatase